MNSDDIIDVPFLDKTRLNEALNRLPSPEQLKNMRMDSLIRVRAVLDELKDKTAMMDQALLDDLTDRLEEAIDGLQEERANYSSLDALMQEVPKDFSIYTPESLKGLQSALKAIDYNLPVSQQEQVNETEHALYEALQNLEKRILN